MHATAEIRKMFTAMRLSSRTHTHTHTHMHAGMRKGTSRHTSCAIQRMRSPGADKPHSRHLHAGGRFSTGAKASVCGHSLWRVCDSMHHRLHSTRVNSHCAHHALVCSAATGSSLLAKNKRDVVMCLVCMSLSAFWRCQFTISHSYTFMKFTINRARSL
jgi:hypothetical protein